MENLVVKVDPETDGLSHSVYPTDIEVKIEPGDSSVNIDSDQGVPEVETEPESGGGDNLYSTGITEVKTEPEPGGGADNPYPTGITDVKTEPGSDGDADNLCLTVRLDVIDQLLRKAGPYIDCRGDAAGRPHSISSDLARLKTTNHYPSLNQTSEKTGRIKARSCRVCNRGNPKRSVATNRKRVETKYCCAQCGNIPLCPAPCFRRWHTDRNF
ncbi:uncharacterized protein [Watersipora subatra]|uniref:uncharacterized protein n=1 Tax=Watersipora subatra TaxID=2589382 RepID=UPI00355C2CCE